MSERTKMGTSRFVIVVSAANALLGLAISAQENTMPLASSGFMPTVPNAAPSTA